METSTAISIHVPQRRSIPCGNISRMRAREELMQSDVFGDDIKNISNYFRRKIRFSIDGYGYRTTINDRKVFAKT
jgi:hypothetical protein